MLVLDGRWLCPDQAASAGADGHNRVIDVDTGEQLLELDSTGVIFRAAFNPGGALESGRYLAVNLDTWWLDIYDMKTGTRVARYQNAPNTIRFDPSGRYLAAGAGTDVFVLDLVELAAGADPDDAVAMSQFSAPGVVAGADVTSNGIAASYAIDSQFIRLWDVDTGDLVAELRTGLDGASPPHSKFSPDGDYLLYPDAGNVLRRLPVDVDQLVELAERRVFRELTVDECRRYLDADDCS
jgi:WD40 repeat protein